MDINNYCVATMSWARDEKEEQLLRESLLALSKLDIPVFITDGGSNEIFLRYLQSLPNFTLLKPAVKGLWPQVQTSLEAAVDAGFEYIIYSEPDKMEFFKTGLPQILNIVELGTTAKVVIAVRSPEGFQSYPAFQRMTETTINNCCSEVTHNGTDYTYGPFIMHASLVHHLHSLREDIAWGWRPYVFVIASRLNLPLETFTGAYFCPADQQADDPGERVYRMKQLSENVEAVVLASRANLT